jgi:predicted TIM-barrel fold metal-dependent hydrolase
LAQKLFAAVPERSLWGTDFPHPNLPNVPDDADLIATLPLLAPDAADRRRLLVENPSHLYA